jgi:hypothetical protein
MTVRNHDKTKQSSREDRAACNRIERKTRVKSRREDYRTRKNSSLKKGRGEADITVVTAAGTSAFSISTSPLAGNQPVLCPRVFALR